MAEDLAEEMIRRGAELLRVGERAGARQVFEEAARRRPDDPRVWLGLSQTAESPQAERHYLNEVLQRDPDNPWAVLALARLDAAAEQAQAPERVEPPPPLPADYIQISSAPLPTPDPWLADAPGTRRCPACAFPCPGNERCPRCGLRLTRRLVVREQRSEALYFLIMFIVGRPFWSAVAAALGFFLVTERQLLLPGVILVGGLALALPCSIPGIWLRQRWGWYVASALVLLDLLSQGVLLILGQVDWALSITSIGFDVLIGLLLAITYGETGVRSVVVDLPPDELMPKTPLEAYNAGVVYSKDQLWYLAARMWQRAVSMNYHVARYRRALGLAYLWLNELKLAESELRAAASIDPADAQVRELLDVLQQKRAQRQKEPQP